MCGIIAVYNKKGLATQQVISQYHSQKARGSDGFGFLSIDNGKLLEVKRSTTEDKIKEALKATKSKLIVFHHRFPTSTDNLIEANHPLKVNSDDFKYDYYVIHNGVINNADEMKAKHERLGYTYETEIKKISEIRTKHNTYIIEPPEIEFNDSESLAIELALYFEGKQNFIGAEGSIAFIALKVNKTTQEVLSIFYGRNQLNPLKLRTKKGSFMLSSEGKGVSIKTDTLYEMTNNDITEKPLKFGEGDYWGRYTNIGFNTDWEDWGDTSKPTKLDRKIERLNNELAQLEECLVYAQMEDDRESEKDIKKQINDLEYKLNDLTIKQYEQNYH